MKKYCLSDYFKKVFIITLIAAVILMFTGCPGQNNENNETIAYARIDSWPEGIARITVVPVEYKTLGSPDFELTKDKLTASFKSSGSVNNIVVTTGSRVCLRIEPEEVHDTGCYNYYAWLSGTDKPKVSVNGTELGDTSEVYEVYKVGNNTKETNLISYANYVPYVPEYCFYTDEFVLAKNNTISFPGLKKVKLDDIKLKNETGYCYVSASNLCELYDAGRGDNDWVTKVRTLMRLEGSNDRPFSIDRHGEPFYWFCKTNTSYSLEISANDNYKLDMSKVDTAYTITRWSGEAYEYTFDFTTGDQEGATINPVEKVDVKPIDDDILATVKTLENTAENVKVTFSDGKTFTINIQNDTYSGKYVYKDYGDIYGAELTATDDMSHHAFHVYQNGNTWVCSYRTPNATTGSDDKFVYFGKAIQIYPYPNVAPDEVSYTKLYYENYSESEKPSSVTLKIKGIHDKTYLKETTVNVENDRIRLPLDQEGYKLSHGIYSVTVSTGTEDSLITSNTAYLYVKELKIPEGTVINAVLGDIVEVPVEMINYDVESYRESEYRHYGLYAILEGTAMTAKTRIPLAVNNGKVQFPTYGFEPTVLEGENIGVDLYLQDNDKYYSGGSYDQITSNKVKIHLSKPENASLSLATINGNNTAHPGDEVTLAVQFNGFTPETPWVFVMIQTGTRPDIINDIQASPWEDEKFSKLGLKDTTRGDYEVKNGEITFTIPTNALPEGVDSKQFTIYVYSCGMYSGIVPVNVTRN